MVFTSEAQTAGRINIQ